MTVVVGYLPHKGGRGALDLGLQLAHAVAEPMLVVTVVPRQWSTPSPAKIDAEFAEYAQQVGEFAESKAREYLTDTTVDVPTSYRAIPGRSSSAALQEVIEEVSASALVLGSSTDGAQGRITVGATTDKLLHSSSVPLVLAPRGYRSAAAAGFARVTCAFSDNRSSAKVVERAAAFARMIDVPLRVASFGVRGATMVTSGVGLSAEDSVLASWQERVTAGQQQLVDEGVIDESDVRVVGLGSGWSESMSNVDWLPTELLALGSSTVGPIARVFLGSRATKIIRHAPVPVVVFPREH